MTRCVAMIVAAGTGQRFGGSVPKQYRDLGGMTVLRRSILAFLNHPQIDDVVVVINPAFLDLYNKSVEGLDLLPPINGGASRQDSVRFGLESLAQGSTPPDFVMIHDGARPFVDARTISDVRKALDTNDGVLAARPVIDTLKRGQAGFVQDTVDRTNLWQAYTPQSFRFSKILDAHRKFKDESVTDDVALAEKHGIPVLFITSNPENMKITTPDDLDRAQRMLGQALDDVRVGMGFDVHRLIPGDAIILGGVTIPHDFKAEGHSDADVVLHAIVDAILGGFGAGDIGTHFPPSDMKWKGADSAMFARHAMELLHERGGQLAHIDVTLMCERPKIGPHREAMVKRLAEILDIAVTRVSIKATTTEKLGFTGRGEGIAAHAIATLRFPS